MWFQDDPFTLMVGKLLLAVSRELGWRYGLQTFVSFHMNLSMSCLDSDTTRYPRSMSEHPKRTGVFQHTAFFRPVFGDHVASLPPYSLGPGTYKSCSDTRVHRLYLLMESDTVLGMLLG